MTPTRVVTAALALAALVIVALVLRSFLSPAGPPPPMLPTATVVRGTVASVATETGTLVPVDQQNVNFRQPGELTEIDVKVGDHVTAGQVLAKIDDRSLRDALSQAQQRQQQDQATLNATLTGNAVQTAQHQVQAAQTALANAIAQANLTDQQDAVSVAQDQSFLARDAAILAKEQAQETHDAAVVAADQAAINTDEAQLQRDDVVLAADQAQVAKDQGRVSVDQSKLAGDQAKEQAACGSSGTTTTSTSTTTPTPPPGSTTTTGTSTTTPNPPSSECTSDQNKVKQDQDQLQQDEKQLAQDQAQVARDQAPVSADQAQLQADSSQLGGDAPLLITDKQLVSSDSTKVEQDQTNLRADLQKQAADQQAGKTAVDQARAALTAAQDALQAQTALRPNTIAGEQAAVAADAAAANTAQQNVGEAVLTAPVDGTVGQINGIVGEQVQIGGGVLTPQAPGTGAPTPNTAASSAFAGSGSPTTGTTTNAQAFITLTDVHSFQVVALVGEGDATRMRDSQDATVSFDALPGVTLPASVQAIAPDATLVQNVTNYLVTLNLYSIDDRLRAGMTAKVGVAVAEARNVLEVPNIALHRSGTQTYVIVVTPGERQVRTPVTTGVVGDTVTEITSGLHEGDRVLLPPVTPPAGNPNEPLS